MRLRPLLLAATLLAPTLLTPAAPAQAAVISTVLGGASFTDTGAPSTFSFAFNKPFAAATGQVQISTYLVGVYADGARNGAGIAPGSFDTLTQGRLFVTGKPLADNVTGAGAPASFAGAGGTVGQVHFRGTSEIAGNAPEIAGGTTSAVPVSPLTGTVLNQSHYGYSILDGDANGVSVTGALAPNANMAATGVNGDTNVLLGFGLATLGVAAAALDQASNTVGCSLSPCITYSLREEFTLSANDAIGSLLRQELGGDPLEGSSVMRLYLLATDTKLFDCGAAGCVAQEVEFNVSGSGGGDAYSFLMLQVVSTVDNPIPEPATLALLGPIVFGWGLAGLAAARRRRA